MGYTQISKKEAFARAPIAREWINRNDIQSMMGVSYEFLANLTQRDDFPRPIGPICQGEWRWRRADILDFMERYEQEVTARHADEVLAWRLSIRKQERQKEYYQERKERLAAGAVEPVRGCAEGVRD